MQPPLPTPTTPAHNIPTRRASTRTQAPFPARAKATRTRGTKRPLTVLEDEVSTSPSSSSSSSSTPEDIVEQVRHNKRARIQVPGVGTFGSDEFNAALALLKMARSDVGDVVMNYENAGIGDEEEQEYREERAQRRERMGQMIYLARTGNEKRKRIAG